MNNKLKQKLKPCDFEQLCIHTHLHEYKQHQNTARYQFSFCSFWSFCVLKPDHILTDTHQQDRPTICGDNYTY
jgi:hypothetical protein